MRNKVLHEVFRRGEDRSASKISFPNFGVVSPFARTGDDAVASGATRLSSSDAPQSVTVSATEALDRQELTARSTNPLSALEATGQNNTGRTQDLFGEVSKNLDRLRAVTEAQTGTIGENTAALASNTASKNVSQALASAGKAASGLFGGLSGLPLISGIVKLFGGGNKEPEAPLVKYRPPDPVHFNQSLKTSDGEQALESSNYDRFGQARLTTNGPGVPGYEQILASSRTLVPGPDQSAPIIADGKNNGDPSSTGQSVTTARAPVNVTVNVQAMDSRSFLDRSGDIAQAVREAMLNMHSINDVVNDL